MTVPLPIRSGLAVVLTVSGLFGLALLSQDNQAQEPTRPEAGSRPAADTTPETLEPQAVTVRILLGVGDMAPQSWDGKVTLDRGQVLRLEGWRFRDTDAIEGKDTWKVGSVTVRKAAAKKATAKKAAGKKAAAKKADGQPTGPGNTGPAVSPNGVIATLQAPDEAVLSVETAKGTFSVKLADLVDGAPKTFLDGRAEVRRVPPVAALARGPRHEDFPTAAVDARGNVLIAYVEHKTLGPDAPEAFRERPKDFDAFKPSGGGDRIRLILWENGRASEPIDVTGEGLDVWRPSVASLPDGRVLIVWSENREGNWDIYARTYDPSASKWNEDAARLTTQPGTDTDTVLAVARDGTAWVAWQAWTNGQADILLAPLTARDQPLDVKTALARLRRVSASPANEWSPAIAADPTTGNLVVAFDSYASGSYDVLATTFGPDGSPLRTVNVAASSRYEARPTVAVDLRGRTWVAYEERTSNWGKDAENLVSGEGTSLYREARVRVRCLEGDRVREAADPIVSAEPPLRVMNSYPRIACGADGRVWLLFRHRQEAIWGNNAVMVAGAVWVEHATSLTTQGWTRPQPLSRSDGLLDSRPALVPTRDNAMLAVYATDGRLRREVEHTPERTRTYYSHGGTPPGVINWDIMIASLTPPSGAPGDPPLTDLASIPVTSDPPAHPDEAAEVQRMRTYRIESGGKTYQFRRGEFHRHTEISMDGGNDGSLEDMWRYAIDAAALDWIGNGDHDNGGGKEYTWWLVQKTTDMYNVAGTFTPVFTYERSVSYPHGHRNVMFPYRGVRTLPRLVDATGVIDADTPMLYDYLKQFGGICASHTSGTGMGTDWRDTNSTYEPIVEIFQGHRNSYEHLGGPRVARRPSEAIGGWRPLGMVWNALAMQYKFGFQASSDHVSTHISYAVALAEAPTREAVFDAFRRRHCYGATDNILLDVRSGEHIMGDEFEANGPVQLSIVARGTRPIARVDIIKDFVYAYTTAPNRPEIRLTWTDEETRPPGESWYYVRVIQDDGEIAWGSPMWITTRAAR